METYGALRHTVYFQNSQISICIVRWQRSGEEVRWEAG